MEQERYGHLGQPLDLALRNVRLRRSPGWGSGLQSGRSAFLRFTVQVSEGGTGGVIGIGLRWRMSLYSPR